MTLYVIFQHGLEPVLIQRILTSFETILENILELNLVTSVCVFVSFETFVTNFVTGLTFWKYVIPT